MTAAARFKQADATRALKAAVQAGLKPRGYRVEPDGSIYVDVGDATMPAHGNPLDRILPR